LPWSYIEALHLHEQTHSIELLKKIGAARPWPTYHMIEDDIAKAKLTWTLPKQILAVTAADNNQVKVDSWDAKRKEETVLCPTIMTYLLRWGM
jgi:hypothetical protein